MGDRGCGWTCCSIPKDIEFISGEELGGSEPYRVGITPLPLIPRIPPTATLGVPPSEVSSRAELKSNETILHWKLSGSFLNFEQGAPPEPLDSCESFFSGALGYLSTPPLLFFFN